MHHKIHGKVIEGKKRGKSLGFPTANIAISENIPSGIYISQTTLDNTVLNSVTFIGKAVTFDEEEIFAETYILDFDKDIYNKEIEVVLLDKIRENEKFDRVEDLTEQIKKDIEKTRNYFK